jgi:collagenase-like PrtC family protease
MSRPITRDDIKEAVRIAEEAFWASIAQQFPEAKTGALDISLSVQTTVQNEKAVKAWVEANIGPVTSE